MPPRRVPTPTTTTRKWWTNPRTVKRGLDMAGFFKAKAAKDKDATRRAEEMPDHAEDTQDYLDYLNAHEEGVAVPQLVGLTVEQVLSLPAPRDEPERWVIRGFRRAPLISGTTADERWLINDQLQQNAAKTTKKALAAGKPDPWAGAPHPPHLHIPGLSKPRHPTAEGQGRDSLTSSDGEGEEVAATPTADPLAGSRVTSQQGLRGNSEGLQQTSMGVGSRGALSPIQEANELEEISGDSFPVASVETAPTKSAGPRGTKRPLLSTAGRPPAKKFKPLGALGLLATVDPAAVAALADAQPEPSGVRERLGFDEDEEEEDVIEPPKVTVLEPRQTRRSVRLQSREPSVAVIPVPVRPPRQTASAAADPPKKSSSSVRKSAAVPQPKVRQAVKSGSKVSVAKVTKNTKTLKANKAKTQASTAAKPKRKKVKRACDECRRKHLSCVHGENAP